LVQHQPLLPRLPFVVNYRSAPGLRHRSGQTAPHLGHLAPSISRNDATLIQKLQPLIEWRPEDGLQRSAVTTSTTGTNPTSHSCLAAERVQHLGRPARVHLPWSATLARTFGIGTFHETWSGYYNGEGDHPYSQLTGDDLMPDAFIGRLSREDYTTIRAHPLNKITGYEQTPYMTDTSLVRPGLLDGRSLPVAGSPVCNIQPMGSRSACARSATPTIDTVFTSPIESRTLHPAEQRQHLLRLPRATTR